MSTLLLALVGETKKAYFTHRDSLRQMFESKVDTLEQQQQQQQHQKLSPTIYIAPVAIRLSACLPTPTDCTRERC